MATAAANPKINLISSQHIDGAAVYDKSGKEIGKIDHFMIDMEFGPRSLRGRRILRLHVPASRPSSIALDIAEIRQRLSWILRGCHPGLGRERAGLHRRKLDGS